MSYTKVLFVIPPFATNPRAPPTGIGYLSEFLTKNGIENSVIDMTLGYKYRHLCKKIERFRPDLLGFFLMTYKHDDTYKLIDKLKSQYKIDTVVGGPHVSTVRKKVLVDCSGIDCGVKLEGEYTLLELVNGRTPKNIDGLIYRDKEVIENKDRDFIEPLDTLPFPTYKKFELNKYTDKAIPLITSRGCPYSCIYCPVKSAIGKKLRVRSPTNVIEEIKYWYENGYRKFDIQDDNFTFYPERVGEICNLIKKERLRGLIFNCPNGIRADRVDKNLLEEMKSVGFKTIAFGVEAGNNRILRNLKKGTTIEVIENAIKNSCEAGFDVGLFFLVGSPGETMKDVEDSIALAKKYPVADAFFYNLVPYPGTELFEWVSENNYFVKTPDEYLAKASAEDNEPLFATPEFTTYERRMMLRKTKDISRAIRKESVMRRSSAYGPIGRLIGYFLCTEFASKHILQQRCFVRMYTFYLSLKKRG